MTVLSYEAKIEGERPHLGFTGRERSCGARLRSTPAVQGNFAKVPAT